MKRYNVALVYYTLIVLVSHSFVVESLLPKQIFQIPRKVLDHHRLRSTKQEEEEQSPLRKEFVSIAFPALLQQAAVPIADIVDAGFLRQLGPQVLGGIGVARASQAAVSKLVNSPLSKTTISLIASKYGAAQGDNPYEREQLSVAVSTALFLALTVGVLQLVVFSTMSRPILSAMGVSPASEMADPASRFLKARALSTPGATLWLVSNGVFRGLGDTTTPLLCSLLLNLVNVALNPIMVQWGGAPAVALGTGIAQFTALLPLLYILNKRVPLTVNKELFPRLLASLQQYLKAGTFVLGRTVARVSALAYCSRQSALLGSVAASAYSVLYQIGFAITLVCESISVASQTLFSRELSKKDGGASHRLAKISVQSGLCFSLLLSLSVFLFQNPILASLASGLEIQQAAKQAIPAFLLTQCIKGLSFSLNGLIMGSLDWQFSMVSMWVANIACFVSLQGNAPSVTQIWLAWSCFMGSEALLGLLRLWSRYYKHSRR